MHLLYVVLEEPGCGETGPFRVAVLVQVPHALVTPEPQLAVLSLLVSSQGSGGVKPGTARGSRPRVFLGALKGGDMEVFRTDMALESLVLAEGLITWWEIPAPVALLALVDGLMST